MNQLKAAIFKKLLFPRIKVQTENEIKNVGLCKISEYSEDDVFIVGYPKSGNTWMQNIIINLYYGIDTRNVPDKLVQELVPDVHYKSYYKKFYKTTFFKSHSLPQKGYKNIIYIVRDGRDVMVSFYHFLLNLNGREPSFKELIDGIHDSFGVAWHEHVGKYIENPFNSRIVFIKYENLIEQDVDELKKICLFLDIERSDEFLRSVYLNNTFAEMKSREKKFGWDNSAWPKDKSFIRRGKVGSYNDEFPKDLLDDFLEVSKKTLKKFNYLAG